MITHNRSIAQTADRVLQVSEVVRSVTGKSVEQENMAVELERSVGRFRV